MDELVEQLAKETGGRRLIVVLGPTAGGKSALAASLATWLHGQVVSMDSMQIYRQMDAGTAKPSATLRRKVVHHLIDVAEPTERFTVADWLSRAEAVIDELNEQGSPAIVTGGTNLYLKALLEGLFDGPGEDPAFRASLEEMVTARLYERVKALDGPAATRIDPNDRRRLVRALEVHHLTGRPLSEWQQQWRQRHAEPYRRDPMLIGLRWPVEAINQRINLRVKAMFYPERMEAKLAQEVCPNAESLPDETARLEAAGLLGRQAREALGYKQVLSHLQKQCSLEEAFEQTKIQTRRFAKQQRTWLKRYRGVRWVEGPEMGTYS